MNHPTPAPHGPDGNVEAKEKVLIFALDGATFDIIRPMTERGELPNLARLMRTGAWGKLHSSIHPITPSAWTSFMTGLNPGRHGVFDFIAPRRSDYGFHLTTALNCREETIWSYLSRRRKRVIVLNVPFTYPPETVNGIMISGLDAPIARREIARPPEVFDQLVERFGEYVMDWTMPTGRRFDLDEYKENLDRTLDYRFQSGYHLLMHQPWDCYMLVFNPTDHVQHIFWKMGEKGWDIIEETYRKVDGYLGRFLDSLDERTTVLIVSDHGAGPIDRVFYLDRWLEKEGYLVLQRAGASAGDIMVRAARRGRTFLRKHLPISIKKLLRHSLPGMREKVETLIATSNVDWSRTRAYSAGYYGNIFINRKDIKPKGTVSEQEYEALRSEIVEKLMQLKDPSTGEKIVDVVYRREEIYHGACVPEAPDLLIRWADYATYTEKGLEAAAGDRADGLFAQRDLQVESSEYPLTGTHRVDGIFIASGPEVRASGELDNLHIHDIFSTVCYLLDVPVPDDRDGRVLQEIFTPGRFERKPPRYTAGDGAPRKDATADPSLSREDEEAISERLRGLGYLG